MVGLNILLLQRYCYLYIENKLIYSHILIMTGSPHIDHHRSHSAHTPLTLRSNFCTLRLHSRKHRSHSAHTPENTAHTALHSAHTPEHSLTLLYTPPPTPVYSTLHLAYIDSYSHIYHLTFSHTPFYIPSNTPPHTDTNTRERTSTYDEICS